MSEKYLDFQEISASIKFIDLLNWQNIAFVEKGKELKGETKSFKFIVNIEKNLFFSPDDDSIKGSVINFLSELNNIGLRQAAKELKQKFLDDPKTVLRDIPELELEYTEKLAEMGISEDVAKNYEIGYVKQRSIMKGRIAFKVYEAKGALAGYVGWNPVKNDWLFPKNFIRPVYNLNRIIGLNEIIVTSSLFDCIYLLVKGYVSTVSLIARSMTDKQEELIKKFEKIILLHPEPENILLRLSKSSFIKAPKINKPLKDYTDEEIMVFVSHGFL